MSEIEGNSIEELTGKGKGISDHARKVLNGQSYGFHYAVLRRADELLNGKQSCWRLKVCEFPVLVADEPSQIDFVLRQLDRDVFLIGECKRPRAQDWCFGARSPAYCKWLSLIY